MIKGASVLILFVWCGVDAFLRVYPSRMVNKVSDSMILASKKEGGRASARRRRRRAGKSPKEDEEGANCGTLSSVVPLESFETFAAAPTPTPAPSPVPAPSPPSSSSSVPQVLEGIDPGLESIEESFGLGSKQLRELMEQDLPVPREDLVTGKTMEASSDEDDKVFNLPDLNEYLEEITTEEAIQREKEREAAAQLKIDRSNREEYERVLELNPFADADESMFEDEYDIFQAIFGTGKLLSIPVPYLQTGHGILLLVTLLAANVYAPGNPLTEFPPEIREFLRTGLLITAGINTVLAVLAFNIANSKNLPGFFWAVKCLLVGGVSFYEINQAKDPTLKNVKDPFGGVDPSIRKSSRR